MYDYKACIFKIVSIILAICLLADLTFSLSLRIRLRKMAFYRTLQILFYRPGFLLGL